MIDTGAGVVDADYRGIVFVLLFNLSDEDFEGTQYYLACRSCVWLIMCFWSVNEGDRVAQLILERIYTPEVHEVNVRYHIVHSILCHLYMHLGPRRHAARVQWVWLYWWPLRAMITTNTSSIVVLYYLCC